MSSVGWVWLSINREIRFIVGIYNNMKNYSKISLFLLIIYVFGADGDDVKIVSVMEGDSLTLDPLTEQFNHIMWWFRYSNSIIAETDGNEPSYTNDERFRDRLKLNNQTGSLTINNMRVTDSGLYHLWIHHNYGIFNQIFNVTVCEPFYPYPDLDLPPDAVTQAVFVVLLSVFAVVAAVSVVLYYRCKISK